MALAERGIAQRLQTFIRPAGFSEAVNTIMQEAGERQLVVTEGPPVYLWPHENHATQHWQHPAFKNGWELVREITENLPEQKIQHALLIDEYNNVPEGVGEHVKKAKVEELKQVLPVAGTIFSASKGDHPHLVRLESDYVRDTQENICSVLDSGFQAEKLVYQMEQRGVEPRDLNSTMLLVVHPEPFQLQQRQMLQALLGRMKEGALSRVNKKYRPSLIGDVYRHVWLDDNGEVTSITKPDMKGGTFVHTPLR